MVKYIVVNTPSAYNLLLGKPSLNRLGAVASTSHMKMKFPSPEGKIITMKVHQKMACKCYENSLRNRKGTYTIITQMGGPILEVEADPHEERQPGPAGEVWELEVNGKKFKPRASLCKELKDKIVEVFSKNMNAFAWSSADMLGIDLDFLSHCLTMDEKPNPKSSSEGNSMRKSASPCE